MPVKMKAIVVDDFAVGQFRIADVDRPAAGAGEILVRIHASGVNPLDSKIRVGMAPHAQMTAPAILGTDLAGTVEAVGADVEGFRVGDEVYGFAGGVAGVQGSLAEFAVVDARLLARKPKNLSMREAASLPLTFITAWEGLVDCAGVKTGDSVLVTGGAGGVGNLVVQLAGAMGARVFATASERHHEYLRQLGATAIDREASVEDVRERFTHGQGFDVIYDTVGAGPLDAAFQLIRNYGHVVSCYGWGTHDLRPLSRRGASYSGVFVLLPLITGEGRDHHGEILAQATRLIEEEKIQPKLAPERFTLAQSMDAHLLVASGRADGKIVIDVIDSI
jgi:NADPH2:quinone reductase